MSLRSFAILTKLFFYKWPEQDTVVATCNMGKLQNNFSEMKG